MFYGYDEFGDYYAPALKAVAAFASSVEVPGLVPENVIDGKLDTRWSSQFSDPQWITIDLGRVCKVDQVALRWENAYAKAYAIYVSIDNVNWKEVFSTKEGRGGAEVAMITAVDARYVRMYGTQRATQWGYSLWEFEVRGEELSCAFCSCRRKAISSRITEAVRPDDLEPCLIFEKP